MKICIKFIKLFQSLCHHKREYSVPLCHVVSRYNLKLIRFFVTVIPVHKCPGVTELPKVTYLEFTSCDYYFFFLGGGTHRIHSIQCPYAWTQQCSTCKECLKLQEGISPCCLLILPRLKDWTTISQKSIFQVCHFGSLLGDTF